MHFKSGTLNRIIDALSRNPVEDLVGPGDQYTSVSAVWAIPAVVHSISLLPPTLSVEVFCQQTTVRVDLAPPLVDDQVDQLTIARDQRQDADIAQIIPFLETGTTPSHEERLTFGNDAKSLLRVRKSMYLRDGLVMRTMTSDNIITDVAVIPRCRRQ